MKKAATTIFILLSLGLLSLRLFSQPMLVSLGYQTKAGIRVTSTPPSTVFINGIEVGKTLYEDDSLKVGKYQVELRSEKGQWKGLVELVGGRITLVNRELSPTAATSSGEVLVLNEGRGVVITSSPSEAEVEIDGKSYGKTPLSIYDLPDGDHVFLLSAEGYLKRSIQAKLPEKMSLHLDVDLALSEVSLVNSSVVPVVSEQKLVVKDTPVGFLRVRDKPSLSGKELGKASPGDSLIMLEDLSGWYKIKLDDGTEGYVSASYVRK